jgi:PII-like signaling protein
VTDDCLKLTAYFGEHERVGHDLVCDALLELYERYELRVAVLLRGTEGFGLKHTLHTQRLLTLSEDLSLVSVAVDARDRIEEMLPELQSLFPKGLITLERARMLTGPLASGELPQSLHEATKLTVYCGRTERVDGRPAYVEVVDVLRRSGVAGATVLLGVDGMVHGARARARFFSRNAEVPLMIVSVGDAEAIAAALPHISSSLDRPVITLERVRVCKRDGALLEEPRYLPEADDAGLGIWEKVMVYAGEQARSGTHPLYVDLIRRLRLSGAAGATALRGIWGYSGDHPPHGDRFFSLARHVPVITVIVDRPEAVRDWWRIVDEVTVHAGLVTTEMVPAFYAAGASHRRGGLQLARHHR